MITSELRMLDYESFTVVAKEKKKVQSLAGIRRRSMPMITVNEQNQKAIKEIQNIQK